VLFRRKPFDFSRGIGGLDAYQMSGRHQVRISHLVFWFALGAALLSAILPPFRYFYLLTPFLVIIALLADGSAALPEELWVYVAFLFGGLIFLPLATKEGMRDLFLAFAGISVGFLAAVPKMRLWTVVLLTFGATMLFFAMFGDWRSFIHFDFMASHSPFESATAFYMGAFAVFAVYRRKWLLYAFCLLCTILFLKRIALVGALLVGVLFLLGEKRIRWLLSPLVMIIVNVAVIGLTMAYALGAFDYEIMRWTDQSANALGQGRQTFLSVPSREIVEEWGRFLLMGKGAGAVYDLTLSVGVMDGADKINLHSDLMKLLYEYGLLWYVVVIGVMYSVRSFRAKLLAVYINVLFVTDNSLIYYLLIFYIVLCARIDPVEDRPAAGSSDERERKAYSAESARSW